MNIVIGGLFSPGPERRATVSLDFGDADRNRGAKRLLSAVDALCSKLQITNGVSIAFIELDADAGRFPDMLASFFSAETWNWETRFYVSPIAKLTRTPSYAIGALNFETAKGDVLRLLTIQDGVRWGPNLRIGGIQVPEPEVATALEGSLFDPEHARKCARSVAWAWSASQNLDRLDIWISPDQPSLHARVAEL